MYVLARLILRACVLVAFLVFGLLLLVAWPLSAWVVAILAVLIVARGTYQTLTTLGSARWADEKELRRAGLIETSMGLSLGRLHAPMDSAIPRAIASLFRRGEQAAEACQGFWSSLLRGEGPEVRLAHAVHTAVFSPTGGGKVVSCVIPFLLTCPDACVVVDFKGENAKLTAKHRKRAFGHKTILLDPFRVVTDSPDTFDPITAIDRDNAIAIDECNALAKALVIRTGEEKEPHWNDAAEAWIAALLATVVCYGDPREGTRSIQTIRDFLSHPQKLALAMKLMEESDAWDGMLARMGGGLAHFVDKEKSSTLTTVSRHLRFLDTVAVAESTRRSSFDPAELRDGKMTVYLILPPEHMRAQSALLRLWIGSLLRAVVRGGLNPASKVHFILDEAASLGHLEPIDDAVDKYRGYGVRLQFYFQSLGQLRTCFPEGQEQTLLSNATQVFFGVNDNATADYVSARLGEQTIVVKSTGTSIGHSDQQSFGAQPGGSVSHSTNRSENWTQQARKLLKPEEVMTLSPRAAITFTPGVRPLLTRLQRYYEVPRLALAVTGKRRLRHAFGTLAVSLLLLATTLSFIVMMFAAIARNATPPSSQVEGETVERRFPDGPAAHSTRPH